MKIILATLALFSLSLATYAYATIDPPVKIVEQTTEDGKISYPQVKGIKDAAIEQKINDDIMKQVADWKCDVSEDQKNGIQDIYFNATSEITQLTPDVLSFATKLDYDCGGPYPDAYTQPNTYDLKTGEVIKLDDILGQDKSREEFGEFVMENYKPGEESCDGLTGLVEFDFYLKPDTVVFIPVLNHANRICQTPVEIPLEKIKPYLKAGTVLKK